MIRCHSNPSIQLIPCTSTSIIGCQQTNQRSQSSNWPYIIWGFSHGVGNILLRSTFSWQYGQVCFLPTINHPRIQNSWYLRVICNRIHSCYLCSLYFFNHITIKEVKLDKGLLTRVNTLTGRYFLQRLLGRLWLETGFHIAHRHQHQDVGLAYLLVYSTMNIMKAKFYVRLTVQFANTFFGYLFIVLTPIPETIFSVQISATSLAITP